MQTYLYDWDNTIMGIEIYRDIYEEIIFKIDLPIEEINEKAKQANLRKYENKYWDSGELCKLFDLMDFYHDVLEREAKKTNHLFKEVIEKIKKLDHVAIVTNSYKKTVELFLEVYEIKDLFEFVFSSDDAKCLKSDERYWEELIKQKNLIPEECVVIGDNKIDDKEVPEKMGFKTQDI